MVDGGYSSGDWGGPAAWGCSVYYPLITNAGWGLGAWGSYGWGIGNDGLVEAFETVAYTPAFTPFVDETVTAADTVAITNQSVLANVTETVSIIDTTSANTAIPLTVTVSEAANIVDETSSNITNLTISTVSEAANITDTTSTNATFVITVLETVNTEDILSTLGIFVVNVDETSNATDQVSPNGVFSIRVSETANAQDSVNRRRLWELIDTGITEDWLLINTY